MKKKLLGYAAVDSGQLLVSDPCYINSQWKKDPKDENYELGGIKDKGKFSYSGCCQATLSEDGGGQLNFELGHEGAGVAFSTGYGDGLYPVYARYNADGRIMKIEIIFN